MKKIDPKDFIKRGWKEYDSGLPPDLFFSTPEDKEPWKSVPHLHLNYSIAGEMQSLTYKTKEGKNFYLYSKKTGWNESNFQMITDPKIKAEALFAKGYI